MHKWSTRRTRWFCFPFCRWRKNGVPVIPIKPPSLLSFVRLGLGGGMGPTNQPQKIFMPYCWEPPFSVFLRGRQRQLIPQVTDIRDQGLHLETPFAASTHCREVANTARRLLFMVRRYFSELSKKLIMPLDCAKVRPHLDYATEANAPTLRSDINQLERAQRIATQLVRGLRHVSSEERPRQLAFFSLECGHLWAELILAFKFF